MKLLWISPFFPYPLDNGSRIRIYNLIKVLAKQHQISLFSLIQMPDEEKNKTQLEGLCSEIWTVLPEAKIQGTFDGKRRLKDVLLGVVDKSPEHFYGPPSPNVVARLKQILLKGAYDVAIIETLFMTNYLWEFLQQIKIPIILDQENVETSIQKQHVRNTDSLVKKLRKWLYYVTFAGFEGYACSHASGVAVVSEKDRRFLLDNITFIDDKRLAIIPNGVDCSWYSNIESISKPNTLIFNGALSYDANFDAMFFFLTEIYPLIRQACPEVNFSITGKTNGINLSGLPQESGVNFTGYLEDIRPAVAQSWACVVPLRVGGGTRLKILEALALGTPVISTSKGAEGLNLIPGRDILIADKPNEFANLVINLLGDSKLRETISTNGKKAVSTYYDWQILGKKFNDFINLTVAKRGNELICMDTDGNYS